MRVTLKPGVDPNLFDCANPKPGFYRSDKGSTLMKPENNVTNRGNVGTQSDHVVIWDIDTGKVIIKQCAEVKGKYTFVAKLDDAELVIGKGCGCGGF